MSRGRALVIAHRTCPLDAPENSLEGICVAAAHGADYVEIDVRRTADGIPVLMHDPLLWRTTGRRWPVRATSSALLRSVRLLANGEAVPFLADVLDHVPAGLGLAIDIKEPAAAPAVLAEVHRAGAGDRVLLWAQHGRAVRYLVQSAPGVEVALLRDTHTDRATTRLLRDAVDWGAAAVSVHQDALSDSLVDRAHQRGLRMYSWFQDRATQHDKIHLGLDGIVTDWVQEARRELGDQT